ncbi:hypothetical protein FRC09_012567 [Ceratobasidium sp. 395]|nr:hypothetical protein FRC09_012567 [Ceratobasidium sp. 395]
MSARKPTEVDPESIAASRSRRQKAGIRQNPDGTVHNANAARAVRIAKDEQASAAAEIEASPFTGDDSLAREPLPTFTHPTPTGNDEEDQAQYEEARLDFLIRYIVIRDAIDLRPDVLSGDLDLASLEEIFKDEEAAAEYLAKETQPKDMPVSNSKGKGKAATTPNSADQTQEPTGYAGISIDSQSQAVTAKYAPKCNPARQASAAQRPSTSGDALRRVVSSSAQPPPIAAPVRANNPQTPRANQSGPAQLHRPNSAATAPGPAHPTTARNAVDFLRQKASGRAEKPAPAQVAHPQAQELDEPAGPIEDDGVEDGPELEEEEAPNAGEGTRPRGGLGKAYVKSFPADQQDVILVMLRLSKARILANGTYDETESTLRGPYELEWPKGWKSRKTRTQIVSESLTDACKECFRESELPFRIRHVQAANILITTFRTSALKEVKHVVDHHFQFATRTKCDWNKDMAESLLPLNFVYSHVIKQEHPFENELLVSACQAVAFGKECAIGARYREELKGIPPGFLAFVCVMIKVVLGGYLTGEWTDPKLDVDVQTTAFRQCLGFLMETHYNKPKQLTSIRTQMWDTCV